MDTNSDSINGFKAVWDKGTLSFRQTSGDVKLLLGRGAVTGTPRELQRVQAPRASASQRLQPFRILPQEDSGEFRIEYVRVNEISQSCIKRGDTVRIGLTGLGGLSLVASDFTVAISGGSLSSTVTIEGLSYVPEESYIEFIAPDDIPFNGFESPQSAGDGTITVSVSGFSDSSPYSEYVFAESTGTLTIGFLPDTLNQSPAYAYGTFLTSWPTEVQVRGYKDYMFRFVRSVTSKNYDIEAYSVAPGSGTLLQVNISDVVGYVEHSGVFVAEPAYPFVQLSGLGARGPEKILLQFTFLDGFSLAETPHVSAPKVQFLTSRSPTGLINFNGTFDPVPGDPNGDNYPIVRPAGSQGRASTFGFPEDGYFYFGYNPTDPMKAFGCNEIVDIPETGIPGYAGPKRAVTLFARIPEHGGILIYQNDVLIGFSAFPNAGLGGPFDFNGSPAQILLQRANARAFADAADYTFSKFNNRGFAAKRYVFTPFVSNEYVFLRFAIPADGVPSTLKFYYVWSYKIRPAYPGDTGFITDGAPGGSSVDIQGLVTIYGEDPVEDWDSYSVLNISATKPPGLGNMKPSLFATFTL
jgi:hypothetical protein